MPNLTIFVTVGSTKFDQLIELVLSDEILNVLVELGFKNLVVQSGNSVYTEQLVRSKLRPKIKVNLFNFKSSIAKDIETSDLVVGHAGAGTSLEVLRKGKKLIVIPNESLMDDHQSELADQLVENKYALRASLSTLASTIYEIQNPATKLMPFPKQEPEKFKQVFDESLKRAKGYLQHI